MGFNYEFGGPFGALSTMLCLPCAIVYLIVSVSAFRGRVVGVYPADLRRAAQDMLPDAEEMVEATFINLAWMAFCVALALFLPGQWVDGE